MSDVSRLASMPGCVDSDNGLPRGPIGYTTWMDEQDRLRESESPEEFATRLQLQHPGWTIADVEQAVEEATGTKLPKADRPSTERR